MVAHHGTFNGNGIIYPPETMSVQYHDGNRWIDAPNQVTAELPDTATRTVFDPVTLQRVRVQVERPGGGRLAMREIEVHSVGQAELERIEALATERTTSEWTDFVLISHTGAGQRRYGDFLFRGELAFVRKDRDGRLVRASVK